MDPVIIAVIGIAGMLLLIALHVPIGIAMATAGFFGVWLLLDLEPAIKMFATAPTQVLVTQELGAIPMFLLMGSFASAAGLSGDLYRLFYALIGHYRGGLAMTTIGGCGGFGAVCGSSLATASTFMRIALPEMRERGYRPSLAAGSIAAGGTLGILIPPSNLMLLYGVLTEQFVIALFAAAVVPGLICIAIYFATIAIYVRVRPGSGPGGSPHALARTVDRGQELLGRPPSRRGGQRRNLWRRVHCPRSGGGRLFHGLRLHVAARATHGQGAARGSGADRRVHRPDLHHHHRRDDIHVLHHAQPDAGGAGGRDRELLASNPGWSSCCCW